MLDTQDYRNAPGGHGPQAAEWEDKPHHLIYDLCAEIERLREALFAIENECDPADPPWNDPEEGRRKCFNIVRNVFA